MTDAASSTHNFQDKTVRLGRSLSELFPLNTDFTRKIVENARIYVFLRGFFSIVEMYGSPVYNEK